MVVVVKVVDVVIFLVMITVEMFVDCFIVH